MYNASRALQIRTTLIWMALQALETTQNNIVIISIQTHVVYLELSHYVADLLLRTGPSTDLSRRSGFGSALDTPPHLRPILRSKRSHRSHEAFSCPVRFIAACIASLNQHFSPLDLENSSDFGLSKISGKTLIHCQSNLTCLVLKRRNLTLVKST